MPGRRRIPRTKSSLVKYYKRKGFRQDPLLQDSKGADLTFTKFLPNGRQKHIRVWTKRRKCIKIEEHVDRADPYQNPLKHLIGDVLNPFHVLHKTRYLPKKRRPRRKTKHKTTRKKRTRSRF